ncbi:F-box protein SKIP23-like [Cicer arietinum]|uniref:F-box protein SKIP23 isoform X2 n=1 Tax=Cicer arietinum TaxID=3827 RepID=A0A3Q7XB76_CICAR|nr:F-box protein SKIP23 isoform X2 [Cicer arietinum]XP_027190835.1 F-box protein SKIP23 isoform X2 [Cicer arietinum]
MADWSELPRDLLQLISEFLQSEFYLLRFRSVCSTWRSSISNNLHLYLPSQFPNPSHSINLHSNTNTFPLSKRTIGPNSRDQTNLFHPLARDTPFPLRSPNVIDFNQLNVIHLGHEFVIGNFISHSPNHNSLYMEKLVLYHDTSHTEKVKHPSPVLLTIHVSGKLAVFRCGDEHWKIIPEMPAPFDDVCVFKGRPIAVDNIGRTVSVGPDLSLDLVAEAVFGGDIKFLVESDGELLLVDKYLSCFCGDRFLEDDDNVPHDGSDEFYHEIGMERAVRFDVYRLHEEEKKWVEVTDLGDRVLFLGEDCAFSASASDLRVGNGNCVVFRDDAFRNHCSTEVGMSVFHLDQCGISPLSVFPSYSKLFWPPPEWAGMVHN